MHSITIERARSLRSDTPVFLFDPKELDASIREELRAADRLLQEEKLIVLALSMFLLFLSVLFELHII